MRKCKNIIFFSNYTDIRAGGPAGYIANLESSIKNFYKQTDIIFINEKTIEKKLKLTRFIGRVICLLIPFQKLRRRMRNLIVNKYRLFSYILNRYQFKTITTHTIEDTLFIHKYIQSHGIKATLLQMSHSPQPPSQEIYDNALSNNEKNAKVKYKHAQEQELLAFNTADMYIFPSPESVECYSKPLLYFNKLLTTHPIKYVRTGCRALETDKTCDEMRKAYGITTKFVISYIGRHNSIKGYDILKKIAEKIFKIRDDVTFLIGGRPSEITPLNHPRWIELGQINPADVLVTTDLFILPNRQTYFDLILLEVLSTGVPVIASNTGGNKTVYLDTKAITLYENVDDCVEKIIQILKLPKSKINSLRSNTKQAYLNNYTLECFARNYTNMISEVCNE